MSQDDVGQERGRRVVRWLVGLGVIVVVALVGLVWYVARSGSSSDEATVPSSPGTSRAAPEPTVSEAGPSGSPAPCTEDDPCLDPPLAEPGADVSVLVTSSGWDAARSVAWVAADIAVLDSSGTCTATLRQGSDQVVQEAPAEAGPRTTSCAVEVDGTRLTAGEWLVTLSYVSDQHSGLAADVSINVP